MKKIFILGVLLLTIGQLSVLARNKKTTKDNFTGYLFTYFEGSARPEEHLRFAISEDGVDWYALNGNRPVISSDTISESGGIRDPHILRGEDGNYYIVATDMHTYDPAQGWGSNPGIVLLKSNDLINWTHSKINLSKDYAENFGDAYWVWAPQTVYDHKAKKYMIYFTLQRSDRKSLISYYAYANKDFTGFESEPRQLFSAKYGSIDNDIIYKDGRYHLFYKGNTKDENGREYINGIQQATSRNIHGPWKEDFKYLDAYTGHTPVEGSGIFKINGREEYVLMYDLYTSGRYEYQTSTDLYNFTKEPKSFRKDFFPRHGTVCSVTAEELERLQQKWGRVLKQEFTSNGNPIIRHTHTADPAALVEGDTLWLFTGHDGGGNLSGFKMRDWCVFSTTDMEHWTQYPCPLRLSDFSWAREGDAYASQVIERNGKYYWYISTNRCGIGVAVADRPEGPYKDALGRPMLTNKDCTASSHYWACIDPTVFIDDDGQAYLMWGNHQCYVVKLKENMVETEGEIHQIHFSKEYPFEEAPWIHKYNGKYYLTYACGFPERIAYSMADNIFGPYEHMGIISEIAGNSASTHPSIVKFRDRWIFFTHNGALPDGGDHSRSVVAEPMFYNADGTIQKIHPSSEGFSFGK